MSIKTQLIAGSVAISAMVLAVCLLNLSMTLTIVLAISVSLASGAVLTGTISEPMRELRDALHERQQAEKALQAANEKLCRWVDELEQRNREIALLSEMSGMLQTCLTNDEVRAVVTQTVQQLFSTEKGAVYMFNTQTNTLEALASWGGCSSEGHTLTPEECWALRRGRAHTVVGRQQELSCRHLGAQSPEAYLCVPMMAYGEILGLLHLQFGPGRDGRAEGLRKSIEDHKQPLAMAVAENIAFSLANLKLHETLYMQSSHDSLTGLFNRRHMEETLEREMHRMGRKGRPLGIIMLDLDHFKQFNDTFGHQAGDTLLRELGSFLQRYIREEDFACRYGGEEFVIILPETSPDITMQRAEKLRSDVRHLYVTHKGQELGPVTLSLGVAGFPLHGLTAETVLRAADSALYRAKAEGRDRVIAAQAIH